MSVRITRRQFLEISASAFILNPLAAGCGRSRFTPQSVIRDLEANETIGKLREGKITFNYQEIVSENGKEAIFIIHRGLIALDLLPHIPECEYGVYGPKTTEATRRLQVWAGIDTVQGNNGKRFDQATLFALEKALQQKIDDRWIPPKNF